MDDVRLPRLQLGTKLQKCIRVGITIFKFFHLGRYIVRYTFGNHVLRLSSSVAVKLNFRPYIRRYTSPNENFEYSYPLTHKDRKLFANQLNLSSLANNSLILCWWGGNVFLNTCTITLMILFLNTKWVVLFSTNPWSNSGNVQNVSKKCHIYKMEWERNSAYSRKKKRVWF